MLTAVTSIYRIAQIFVAQNFHEFCKKICFRKNIIMNITGYSVIIFFDTFLIHEIRIAKIQF